MESTDQKATTGGCEAASKNQEAKRGALEQAPEAMRAKDGLNTLRLVQEFHKKFEVFTYGEPTIIDTKLNNLREDLLQEELNEFKTALRTRDEVAVFDALLDMQVVLDGAFDALGMSSVKEEGFLEVHRSNMSKLGGDGKPIRRGDGKVLKGPNYSPPDLAPILAKAYKKN